MSRVSCRRQTEELNLIKVLRKLECVRDLTEGNHAAFQQSFDYGTNFIAVLFPLINMPRGKALYKERLHEMSQKVCLVRHC